MSRPPPRFTPTLSQKIMRGVYSVLVWLVIPFAIIKLFRRNTDTLLSSRAQLAQRFGVVQKPRRTGGYLFHCVSVGEVVAASCVINKLLAHEPHTPITLTTTTTTGAERVRTIYGDKVQHSYLPFDSADAMRRLLERIKPKAVVITEVELWPNMLHRCWQKAIPVVLINARMTDRSARRYQKISALFSPMLQKLAYVCAQGQRDYDNYLRLGMPVEKLILTNNIKFDQAVANTTDNALLTLNSERPIIVAGSTHDPEELILLNAVNELRPHFPQVLLVLVPRHPERFSVVANLLAEREISYVKTSETRNIEADCEVVLLDQMGLLNQAYQQADIAFVGGSLANRGGHNALEPAALSKPVIMGPHRYNNPVICEYLEQNGALKLARDQAELSDVLSLWLANHSLAQAAGHAGYQVLQENKGALDKTLLCISNSLTSKG
ncbi:lipid IV(A) 3-deoxy-D-manno-octulosonic acid transferase [Alteromonas lipotrueiana]|uniref:lipid IV(A) 3-deoxy-D-manno-octulosonic acid transferase n=1 Tax=Alteromonas lipotrueiana TaxID=2803815 RepID=UPI0031B87898